MQSMTKAVKKKCPACGVLTEERKIDQGGDSDPKSEWGVFSCECGQVFVDPEICPACGVKLQDRSCPICISTFSKTELVSPESRQQAVWTRLQKLMNEIMRLEPDAKWGFVSPQEMHLGLPTDVFYILAEATQSGRTAWSISGDDRRQDVVVGAMSERLSAMTSSGGRRTHAERMGKSHHFKALA